MTKLFSLGFPKTTKLRAITKFVASSPSEKLSVSLQPTTEAAVKKGENPKKNIRSPNSSDAPVEAKKKNRIMVRVRKSSKKAFSSRVPDSKALYRLKDYPEDEDDMEFITHKSIDIDQAATASQESPPVLIKKTMSVNANVIDVLESPSNMEAFLDKARATAKNRLRHPRSWTRPSIHFSRAYRSA